MTKGEKIVAALNEWLATHEQAKAAHRFAVQSDQNRYDQRAFNAANKLASVLDDVFGLDTIYTKELRRQRNRLSEKADPL